MSESQTDAILRLLRDNPDGITALDVFKAGYGMRAAARIADLRAAGNDISAEMVTTDSGKRVARYRLARPLTLWGAVA